MTKIGKFWRPFIASKFAPPTKKRMMFVPPLSMIFKQSSPMSLITIIMRVIKSAIPVGLRRINLLYVDYQGGPVKLDSMWQHRLTRLVRDRYMYSIRIAV